MARKILVKGFLISLLVVVVIFVINGLKDQIQAVEQVVADSERSVKFLNTSSDQLVPDILKTNNSDQLVEPTKMIADRQVESESLNTITEQQKLKMEPWALCIEYWEQSASVLRNLFDFQCWASSVGINRVVEPVVSPKGYGLLKFFVKDNSTRFRDLFDLDHWNDLSTKLSYSPLAAMEQFFDSGVRQFVYVHIKYHVQPKPCPTKAEVFSRSWYIALIMRGFSMMKIVCIDILRIPSHTLTRGMFTDAIFHNVGHQVNVIFNEWRGIEGGKMKITGSNCTSTLGRATSKLNVPYMIPSQKLSDLVDTFIREHLSSAEYVVVMLRSEKLARSVKSTPVKSNACIDRILYELKDMLQSDMRTLFMSDIGEHGSTTLKDSSALSFSQKLETAVNADISLKKMNSIFEDMLGPTLCKQISILQQQLAVRAKCIITVGGGNFQGETVRLHAYLYGSNNCHKILDSQCKYY